jgi:ferric-dicitrate binding protein FerR (iron transport regulator)
MQENISEKRLRELAEKWLKGTITAEEEKEYAEWFNSLSDNDRREVPPSLALSREEHRRKLLAAINRKRYPLYGIPTKTVVRVAAAILLLAFGTITWLSQRSTSNPLAVKPAVTNAPNDIAAGTEGAVLKLANGRTILLDTAKNGNLSTGLAATVVKSNGTLAINGDDAAVNEAYNTLITPRARQQRLVLNDGTQVWLNAESSIHFPVAFHGNTREVEITGEAYFEVAKDAGKPFIVHVNDAAVTVLGTHFNVMAYSNEPAVVTTLVEGAVKFTKRDHSLMLKPGQQSRMSGNEVKLVPDADVDLALAWMIGMQSFDSADIRSIMLTIERWYDVDVVYEGNIPYRTFSGEIPRSANLSQLLKLLEIAKIHVKMDADKKKLIVIS